MTNVPFADSNRLAYGRRAAAEPFPPEPMADDHHVTVFVCVEESAHRRAHSQYAEVVRRDERGTGTSPRAGSDQRHRERKARDGLGEDRPGLVQRPVECEREPRSRLAGPPDDEELVRFIDGKRTDKERIDGAEHGRCRTQT